MAKKLYEEHNIQEIANAIREKTGSTDKYSTDEMALAIRNISGEGSSGIDLSGDTVMPGVMLKGMTAHDAQGRQIVGTIPTYECDTDGVDQLFQEKTVTENGEVTPDEGYLGLSKVNVDVQAVVAKTFNVIVIDYDGTVLRSAQVGDGQSFMLPEPPTREGLVFQEWSCALPITDNTVTVNGQDITIGAVYITDDGATRFHIEFESYHDKSFTLYCGGDITIDWGDGTAIEAYSGDVAAHTHVYAPTSYPAKYVISVTAVSGELTLGGRHNMSMFTGVTHGVNRLCNEVNIGANVTSLPQNTFEYCDSLLKLSMPTGVVSIGAYAFANGKALQSIVLPSSVTTIGNYAFNSAKALKYVALHPNFTTLSDYIFQACVSLRSFTFCESLSTVGKYTFGSCTSLERIFFPNADTAFSEGSFYNCTGLYDVSLPANMGSMTQSGLAGCTSLKTLDLPHNFTSVGQYAFAGNSSLVEINFKQKRISASHRAFANCTLLERLNGVDEVVHYATETFNGCTMLREVNMVANYKGSLYNINFGSCENLRKFVVHENFTAIDYSAFTSCKSLEAVFVRGSLTKIARNVFYGCTSLCLLDMRNNTTVPTLENVNAFTNVPTTCKIVVPDELYDSWIAATNWTTYSYMICKASEVPEQ